MSEPQPQPEPPKRRLLSEADYRLSTAVSRRPRSPGLDEDQLRSMLVHRLTDTAKAVSRASLRDGSVSVFCEGCRHWTRVKDFPLEFDCICGRSYRTEFVVLEEVEGA